MALFLLKKRRKTRLEETNMNRNTLAALSLTASLSLTLAACGSGGGTAQSPAPAASTPPAASGAPSGGVEDGVLTVGMECAYRSEERRLQRRGARLQRAGGLCQRL